MTDDSEGSPDAISSSAPVPSPSPPPSSGRADVGKRMVAAIIDAVITIVIGFVPIAGGIAATAYWLVRDGMDLEFMDHRSIGKKIMKLRPVTLDGGPVDLATSLKRNWMFAIGGVAQFFAMTIIGLVIAIPLFLLAIVIAIVEVVLVFVDPAGQRVGDKMAGTRVIETDS